MSTHVSIHESYADSAASLERLVLTLNHVRQDLQESPTGIAGRGAVVMITASLTFPGEHEAAREQARYAAEFCAFEAGRLEGTDDAATDQCVLAATLCTYFYDLASDLNKLGGKKPHNP